MAREPIPPIPSLMPGGAPLSNLETHALSGHDSGNASRDTPRIEDHPGSLLPGGIERHGHREKNGYDEQQESRAHGSVSSRSARSFKRWADQGRGPKAAALPAPPSHSSATPHATPRPPRRLDALSAMPLRVPAASSWATPVSAARLDAASAASSIVACGSSSR